MRELDETVLAGPHFADVALKVPASLTGPKRTQNASGQIWVTDHKVRPAFTLLYLFFYLVLGFHKVEHLERANPQEARTWPLLWP